jgi:hypothetical protein
VLDTEVEYIPRRRQRLWGDDAVYDQPKVSLGLSAGGDRDRIHYLLGRAGGGAEGLVPGFGIDRVQADHQAIDMG